MQSHDDSKKWPTSSKVQSNMYLQSITVDTKRKEGSQIVQQVLCL